MDDVLQKLILEFLESEGSATLPVIQQSIAAISNSYTEASIKKGVQLLLANRVLTTGCIDDRGIVFAKSGYFISSDLNEDY